MKTISIHESGEDYLEQILILSEKHGGFARSIDIANGLNVTKPSVSFAMKNLRESGYITMDEDSHIRLTEEGNAIAVRILDRHRRLTQFLISLGVSEDQAKTDACKMEHDLSDETFQAMVNAL